MPRKRADVETIREIRELKLSIRKIADALEISQTSVGDYLSEYKRSGLTYKDIIQMGDTEVLEVFESRNKASNPMYETLSGEFPVYEKELARVGVTL
jgi:predicted transcriptional regulator